MDTRNTPPPSVDHVLDREPADSVTASDPSSIVRDAPDEIGTPSRPGGQAAAESEALDAQLDQSFPASDPPSISGATPDLTTPARPSPQAAAQASAQEAALDAQLEDSFPASDPPAMTQPTGSEMPS